MEQNPEPPSQSYKLNMHDNKTLKSITQCTLCYTQYDSQFHIPLGLKCQHNICTFSLDKLYKNDTVECPFCKSKSTYENKSQIPKNFTMLEIIQVQEQPSFQFNISFDDEVEIEKPINDLIQQIKNQNQKIEEFLQKIVKRVQTIQDFNQELIRFLEIFNAQQIVERKKIIKNHFNKAKNVSKLYTQMDLMEMSLKKVKKRLEEAYTNASWIKFEDAKKEILYLIDDTSETNNFIDFEKMRSKNEIFNNELAQDYQYVSKAIKKNILKHMSSSAFKKRNFIIKKQKSFQEIIDVLIQEALMNKEEALNSLGFIYYHGIEVDENPILAYEYFKRSSEWNNLDANFICYCLEENIDRKYKYFSKGILSQDQKVFGTLGYLIDTNKLDNVQERNKIAASLYQASAKDGIPVSMSNFAYALEQGEGITQNYDLAAEYFYKSMKAGYLEARKWLDELYPQASEFRKKYTDYKTLKAKNYKEYENQEVLLF